MNLPSNTLRKAIYDALATKVGITVYSWPPATAENYVLIGDISERDDSYQTKPIWDCYVPIEIITKTALSNTGQGTKTTANTCAAAIDAIMKPTLITFVPVTGYNVTNCVCDDKSEDLSVDSDVAIYRIQLVYYMRIIKT